LANSAEVAEGSVKITFLTEGKKTIVRNVAPFFETYTMTYSNAPRQVANVKLCHVSAILADNFGSFWIVNHFDDSSSFSANSANSSV